MMNRDCMRTSKMARKACSEKPHSQYAHNGYEDNADAHLKRQLMGREAVVAITDGKRFWTWEQIFYTNTTESAKNGY